MSTESQFLEATRRQLVAERIAAGFTLDELAEALTMSRSTLHRLEKGRAVPDLKQLDELAAFYGMTLMDLMRRIDERADLVDGDELGERRLKKGIVALPTELDAVADSHTDADDEVEGSQETP